MAQGPDYDLELSQAKSDADTEDTLIGDGGDQTPSASRQPEKPTLYPTKQSKSYLHGLRGLAALLVYLAHNISWWYGPAGPIEDGFGYHGRYMIATFPFIRTLFTGGAAAVSVFFVLSGYVLSLSTLQTMRVNDEHGGRQRDIWRGLISAIIRRPFRLYIPLIGVSLSFAILMHMPLIAPYLIWPKAEPSLLAELWRWAKEIASTMNPFRKYGGAAAWFPYNPPAWTMSGEFKGSLVVFILLGVYSHAPPRYRFSLFAVTGAICLYFIGDWVVACFMWGVCLAMLDMRKTTSPPQSQHSLTRRFLRHSNSSSILHSASVHQQAKTAFFTFLFFLSWYLICQPTSLNPERLASTPGYHYFTYHLIPYKYLRGENWRFWNTISATAMVYSISHLSLPQRLLSMPTMQFLGKISFTLYLVHMPILWTVGDRIMRMLGVQRGDFVTWWDDLLKIPDIGPKGFSSGWIISQMLVYPISASLALVLYKLFDEPSTKIGKHVASRAMPWLAKREDKIIRALNNFVASVTPAAFLAARRSWIGGGGSGGSGGNAAEISSSSASAYPSLGDVERQQGKIQ
ncbi:hypothetical protein DV737_g5064, partial [Chaetothyriales sp. CBS 132003]